VFLDSSGNGTDTAAAEAIGYAVNHGAPVINASWGGTATDATIESAIAYADEHNVIIVAAAGNNSADDDNTFFSPASYSAQYPNLISVAAIGGNGALASLSNYGVGTVQLAAPGVDVYSTVSNGTYGTDSGTSMAAPLVTGAVALVKAAHPSWTMSQVVDAILDNVTPDPSLAGAVTTGGVLNVGAAVANSDGPYVISATPDGSINTGGGFSSVQLTFNEEINPATFTAAQVTFTGPGGVIPANEVTVKAVSGSNDHEFQVSLPAQTGRRHVHSRRRPRHPGLVRERDEPEP
jgi:serine protease